MAIVGYMGSGKSTVGSILARKLGREFIDLDHEISCKANRIIPEIFEEFGERYFGGYEHEALTEAHFRGIEHEALVEALAGGEERIIACGGGVVVHPGNRERLKDVTTVFLEEDIGVLYKRTRGSERPLRGVDLQKFKQRYASRLLYYREVANLEVSVRGRSPNEVAEEVLRWLSA